MPPHPACRAIHPIPLKINSLRAQMALLAKLPRAPCDCTPPPSAGAGRPAQHNATQCNTMQHHMRNQQHVAARLQNQPTENKGLARNRLRSSQKHRKRQNPSPQPRRPKVAIASSPSLTVQILGCAAPSGQPREGRSARQEAVHKPAPESANPPRASVPITYTASHRAAVKFTPAAVVAS
jgi:hypothetical protein